MRKQIALFDLASVVDYQYSAWEVREILGLSANSLKYWRALANLPTRRCYTPADDAYVKSRGGGELERIAVAVELMFEPPVPGEPVLPRRRKYSGVDVLYLYLVKSLVPSLGKQSVFRILRFALLNVASYFWRQSAAETERDAAAPSPFLVVFRRDSGYWPSLLVRTIGGCDWDGPAELESWLRLRGKDPAAIVDICWLTRNLTDRIVSMKEKRLDRFLTKHGV